MRPVITLIDEASPYIIWIWLSNLLTIRVPDEGYLDIYRFIFYQYWQGPSWVVGSNTAQAKCTRYNIMWYSLSVTCDRSVVFLCVLRFPPKLKLTATI